MPVAVMGRKPLIIVQDKIVVDAEHLGPLLALVDESYKPGAAQRGLSWQSSELSPPVLTSEAPTTLWIRWTVPDVERWWAMRAQSSSPDVTAFWSAVDALCHSRQRTYLGPVDDTAPTPPPEADTAFVSTRGYRVTAQLALKSPDSESPAQLLQALSGELPGLEHGSLQRNLAPEYAAGHLTWDLLFAHADAAAGAWDSDVWRTQIAPALEKHCSAVHALCLETIGGGIRDPGIASGIKRTAFFRLLPGCDPDTAAQFECDLLAMPRHIPEIINWRLSLAQPANFDAAGVAPWTYVWEQEFASLEGLTGPYMSHPHHWAYIDRWFDFESGAQAVDNELSHAFSPLPTSVLGRELVPDAE